MYVDEAHSYKNAFLYTKMRNVAGIAQNEAQKSADMFNKCQYLDEITGGKGITFATGTPISNSMTELYVMQRYLSWNYVIMDIQQKTWCRLEKKQLWIITEWVLRFIAWAAMAARESMQVKK